MKPETSKTTKKTAEHNELCGQQGRIGYLVLWMLGTPIGVLLLLWVLLGNNIIGPG